MANVFNQEESLDTELPSAELVKSLLDHIEQGNFSDANDIVRDISFSRENNLYQQIGRLTRELHDAMRAGPDEAGISQLATGQLSDARVRLQYVVDKTSQSANKTMDGIENTMPLVKKLAKDSAELFDEWKKFSRRELTVDDFKTLYATMMTFLESVKSDTDEIQTHMQEIIMAQDYQDLTGQVINQVNGMMSQLEDKLVAMVTMAGGQLISTDETTDDLSITAEGPNATGKNSEQYVKGQGDVDDLLSSLGF